MLERDVDKPLVEEGVQHVDELGHRLTTGRVDERSQLGDKLIPFDRVGDVDNLRKRAVRLRGGGGGRGGTLMATLSPLSR